ncbi:MAG TPA: phasin family protein, partial [Candidatus Dormibacteraeota bacterium]|nr:phasin family protein [Candidatus Dormibacteraeota bacterium]
SGFPRRGDAGDGPRRPPRRADGPPDALPRRAGADDFAARGPRRAAGFDRPRAAGPDRPRAAGPDRPRRAPARADHPAPRRPEVEAPAARNGWLDLVLNVLQAPVGLAQSQADKLVSELVRGGQIGQREAERLLGEVRGARERAGDRAQQEADRLDRFVESRIEDILNRVNIPSRSDIERLNQSVDVLTRKVEALLSRQDRV